ncbi:SU10 major capsid protein, partial [Bacillus cereus group sp. BC241]|uniref:SU10 major capsid protein n=1 Tax=Bacillus cereus group sp. BC241 TaxID=3445333 RepID=UPI003F22B44B
VEFSRRALATIQFGDTNSLAFQVAERIRQLTIQMDRALVRGRKATATIGTDTVTYTGGLRYLLDQAGAIKTDNGAAALTLDAINVINA